MPTIKTSVETLLQALIDEAVDDVCAEYDERGSIKARAVVYIEIEDDLKKAYRELTIQRSRMTDLPTLLQEAYKGISEAENVGTAIICISDPNSPDVEVPSFEPKIELVFIYARCAGRQVGCLLVLDRKTGSSDTDLVLVTEFDKYVGSMLKTLRIPTEWAGPTCRFDLVLT